MVGFELKFLAARGEEYQLYHQKQQGYNIGPKHLESSVIYYQSTV